MERELKSIHQKLYEILKNQKSIQAKEQKILDEENKVEAIESSILSKEDKLMKEERAIRKSLKHKILSKVTLHDVNKGIIGAFVGTIGHFAFFEGKHIAEQISFGRASLLYLFAYLTGSLLIYSSGFRKVKKERLLHLVPIRVTLMFIISIVSSIFILFMFDQISFASSAEEVYKIVANVSVLAMFGAATADFIGD